MNLERLTAASGLVGPDYPAVTAAAEDLGHMIRDKVFVDIADYTIPFRAVAETLRKLAADARHQGLEIGLRRGLHQPRFEISNSLQQVLAATEWNQGS